MEVNINANREYSGWNRTPVELGQLILSRFLGADCDTTKFFDPRNFNYDTMINASLPRRLLRGKRFLSPYASSIMLLFLSFSLERIIWEGRRNLLRQQRVRTGGGIVVFWYATRASIVRAPTRAWNYATRGRIFLAAADPGSGCFYFCKRRKDGLRFI